MTFMFEIHHSEVNTKFVQGRLQFPISACLTLIRVILLFLLRYINGTDSYGLCRVYFNYMLNELVRAPPRHRCGVCDKAAAGSILRECTRTRRVPLSLSL